jgi:hypothetical protein
VDLVRIDVSEEAIASVLLYLLFFRSVFQLIFNVNVSPSSLILITLMMEELRPS